jgi:hypothetical protein
MTRDELLTSYASGNRDFAGANLTGANLTGANLAHTYLAGASLADASLAGANLTGANLTGANLARTYLAGANLARTYLAGANLTGANLTGANLAGADLTRAYLAGAYLAGADLAGADLGDQWIIQGPCRSDGYYFFLQKLTADAAPMVKAGCRYFTLPQAREHWQATRGGTPLGDETFAILTCLEAMAVARGLIKGE